jgi:hypothetical protein
MSHSMGIEAASQAPATMEFNMGVFDLITG